MWHLAMSWHCRPRCDGVVAIDAQAFCHCCNGIVALVMMVLLPLPMRMHLAIVNDDVDDTMGDNDNDVDNDGATGDDDNDD
jgi:hypothetical protein